MKTEIKNLMVRTFKSLVEECETDRVEKIGVVKYLKELHKDLDKAYNQILYYQIFMNIEEFRAVILSIELLLKTYNGDSGEITKSDEIVMFESGVNNPWMVGEERDS